VAHSAQADSDPFPGHIPARLRPLGLPAEHRDGSGRLGSQRTVTSHDADHSDTAAGTGIYPARARGSSSRTNPIVRKTQQAKGGVRRGYYDKAYVGARPKLYVQRTLEHSCTGRESHTTAPAVWHTVPSCRRTCWVRTPSASHRYVSTHLQPRLPTNVHIRATSEGASSISRGGVLAHCRLDRHGRLFKL
jgi:hypothetical protein